MNPLQREDARRSWREVVAHHEEAAAGSAGPGEHQLLELARWIAATAYAPSFRAGTSHGRLCISGRPPGDGEVQTPMLAISIDGPGWFRFEIRGAGGRFLLRRRCEGPEVERVLASALLRLQLADRGESRAAR